VVALVSHQDSRVSASPPLRRAGRGGEGGSSPTQAGETSRERAIPGTMAFSSRPHAQRLRMYALTPTISGSPFTFTSVGWLPWVVATTNVLPLVEGVGSCRSRTSVSVLAASSIFASRSNVLLLGFLVDVADGRRSCETASRGPSPPPVLQLIMQHRLYFRPLPHGQGSFRPTVPGGVMCGPREPSRVASVAS
jgi:hypothetical protein